MRIRVNERLLLFLTYMLLILFFLQAQSVTGPYEEAIRARVASPGAQKVLVNH